MSINSDSSHSDFTNIQIHEGQSEDTHHQYSPPTHSPSFPSENSTLSSSSSSSSSSSPPSPSSSLCLSDSSSFCTLLLTWSILTIFIPILFLVIIPLSVSHNLSDIQYMVLQIFGYILIGIGVTVLLHSLRFLVIDGILYKPKTPPLISILQKSSSSSPINSSDNNAGDVDEKTSSSPSPSSPLSFPCVPPPLSHRSSHRLTPLRRLTIIVNPFGGGGSALSLYHKSILPLLSSHSHVTPTLLLTTHHGHFTEYGRTLSFSTMDAVIIMGGDGSISEFLNGMMNREDKMVIPIGIIPTGTGNSVAYDLMLSVKDEKSIQNVVDNILYGEINWFDMNLITDSSRSLRYFSLNEISMGLVGDAAVLAESLRWLGAARYDIAALWIMMKKKFLFFDFKMEGIAWMRHKDNKENNQSVPTPNAASPTSISSSSPIALSLHGTFVTVFINNNQHFGKQLRATPFALINDGYFDLVYLKDASRGQLLSLFQLLPKGNHGNHSLCQTVQARKVTVNMEKRKGIINIDGENVQYEGQMEIECCKRVIPILIPKDYFEKGMGGKKIGKGWEGEERKEE